jgi:hypothetical protein
MQKGEKFYHIGTTKKPDIKLVRFLILLSHRLILTIVVFNLGGGGPLLHTVVITGMSSRL